MPTIDINDAYILDNTGAQVDASVDYAYANSNRNLLDNPFFTVRQRGDGPFTGNVYGVDRWRGGNSRTTITGNSGYITLATNSSGNGFLRQILPQTYEGTYTLSAVVGGSGSGTLFFQDSGGTILGGEVGFTTTGDEQLVTSTFTTSGTPIGGVAVRVNASNTIEVVCAKLELGPYSTLVNDTPPDYGTELAKCQYYFRRVSGDVYLCSGMAVSTTAVVFPFPFTMRANPTITMTGTISAVGSGGILAVSSINAVGKASNAIQVRLTVSGATQYGAYLLTPSNGGYLDFTADL